MLDEREERRVSVFECLRKCSDEKLLRGGRVSALACAREAYELANRDPPIAGPLRELSAYRLAMLELRRPDRSLEEVDLLLQQAAGSVGRCNTAPIGPLPLIYRLAVLGRQRAEVSATHELRHLELQEKISTTFAMARNSVMQQTPDGKKTPLQQPFFNLLELSALFLNLGPDQLSSLEGIGSLPDVLGGSGWMLVGPSPEISRVRYSKALAEAELEERGMETPTALLFKFDGCNASWRRASDSSWQAINIDWASYLSARLARPLDSGVRELMGMAGESERYRQLKKRLKDALTEKLESSVDLGIDSQPLTLPFPIYGAVKGL